MMGFGNMAAEDLSIVKGTNELEFILQHKVNGAIVTIIVSIEDDDVKYLNFPEALNELLTAYTKT